MIKRWLFTLILLGWQLALQAQCSLCTKTAASLDEKSARGLNSGIIYLAFLPMTMIILVGYRWWRQQRGTN